MRGAKGGLALPGGLASLWQHRGLIGQMVRREVVGRYKGSLLGLAWSFFYPLVMLSVFTFVFGVVFKMRWAKGGSDLGHLDFALVLFVGLTMFNFVAECANRAPSLITDNVSYVKKVVFPLEILPVVALGASLFHWLVGGVVLCLAMLVIKGGIPLTAVFVLLIIVPLAAATLGLAWFLASIGVYLRDVAQTVGIGVTALQFLSPIFYPVSAVPKEMQFWMMLNPLTFVIEQSRAAFIWGQTPDWLALLGYTVGCFGFAWAGYWWFQKTRKGFADVL